MTPKIEFLSENKFMLSQEGKTRVWLLAVIASEKKTLGEIGYVFCNDAFLLDLNKKYLDHDTYTDIISFDYSYGNTLQGEIYISTERVMENAKKFSDSFEEELRRVLVHGVLHLCGFKDKTEAEAKKMREKENEKLKMFHVEHFRKDSSKPE